MTLANGKNYVVVKQAVYKNENYYAVVAIDNDMETLLEEYNILHEINNDNQICVEKVTDPEVFKLVSKYLNLITDEDWKKEIGS